MVNLPTLTKLFVYLTVITDNINQLPVTKEKSHFMVEEIPSVILTAVNPLPKQPHDVITTTPTRTVSVELISNRAVKFKVKEKFLKTNIHLLIIIIMMNRKITIEKIF